MRDRSARLVITGVAAILWACGGGGDGDGGMMSPNPDLGTIEGTVTDDAGDPISGVTVRLQVQGSGVDQETRTTTSNGAFMFSDIDPGDYDVRVDVPATFELDGQANPIQVDVQAGQTANISFVLQLLAGTVNGTVSTGGGAGVRGMTVGLRSRGSSTDQRTATTNAGGDFTFTRVPVGEWDIFLRGDVQTANPVEVSVDEGQTVTADFTASITVEFASDIQPVFTGRQISRQGKAAFARPRRFHPRLLVHGRTVDEHPRR
ncbi:MAG: carboxypeptidase-like regulatory domain-containing protein, partial [Halobacteriales archaeon]|nr:carboxypeptidase-like regulatory domain-containing protein [Halobacteriales archaeon]